MRLTVNDYLERAPATSKAIQLATKLSQTSVARQLRKMGQRVIKIQNGRTPLYALTCNAFGLDDKIPLSMIDTQGNARIVAFIRPLAHGGFFVERTPHTPNVLLGTHNNGLYDDLPYFLSDLRPQGFLGRQIAQQLAAQSNHFPPDPRHWNTNHIGRYLISNGDDLAGNFQLGEVAHTRIRQAITPIHRCDYPALANNVMNGLVAGSSAGGEHPKFTAYCQECAAHVIVKFSPKGDNEVAQRWRDILITEFHANAAIHHAGYCAADTQLIEQESRLFLESVRFDRAGELGRESMLSLQMVDAELTGLGNNWLETLQALHNEQLISEQDVITAEFLSQFGRLINNTDMHLGNLSLGIKDNRFYLLPVYDMCSMGFAPKSGEVQNYAFSPPTSMPAPAYSNTLNEALIAAKDFWDRIANDKRISDSFKQFLDDGKPVDSIVDHII